jgi:hypothetical protein
VIALERQIIGLPSALRTPLNLYGAITCARTMQAPIITAAATTASGSERAEMRNG